MKQSMRLSGVDPSIIRELSGIYKPFVKAFKELVANAYDADATTIKASLDPNFTWLELLDDGCGMTPYHFHHDFTRLGGSSARLKGGRSPGGRPRVGFKGIGFLAVARYCRALEVESISARPYRTELEVATGKRTTQSIAKLVGDLIPFDDIADKIKITSILAVGKDINVKLKAGKDYEIGAKQVRFLSQNARGARAHRYCLEVDCSQMVLAAKIDFDYLLGLENSANLSELEDFCQLTTRAREEKKDPRSFTRLRLRDLKDFVIRDLGAPPIRGKTKNIVFKSGKDRFLWDLARSSPIRDEVSAATNSKFLSDWRTAQETEDLPTLEMKWGTDKSRVLRRPIFIPSKGGQPIDETLRKVCISEAGLRVEGYILARSEVIYPAELRGIAIRVHNVTVGNAGFFGWENILSGPRKAALSQISGELCVHEGLEASDAINPGRESFYEENPHYRTLKHILTGSGETIGGIVGTAVNEILDRIRVRSQVRDSIEAARVRRRTLSDISGATGFYARPGSREAKSLMAFFRSGSSRCELAEAKTLSLRPGHKLGGFEVESTSDLGTAFEIDYENRRVRMDYGQEAWSTSVFLHGQYYELVVKDGRPNQPICEFDHERKRIYVNWGHPVKQNMDDQAFLKSAVLFRLAYHAAPDDADSMMSLALGMMSFRSE
jgi:hypothetical protein